MKMKKFINNPATLRNELLEGLALAHRNLIELTPSGLVVNRKLREARRVTLVTLGGTGHEPALSGFVGEGMLDISVPGDIFAAPGPNLCLEALKLADRGQGVLFIVLNHAGDMMTGNMTLKLAEQERLNVIKVVTQEDVSNAPRSQGSERRGLVGCVPLYKICGAAAREGKSLPEVAAIAQRFADNMATIAVACKGATHPATGNVIADLPEDEMEIGMGQHGEGGGGRMKLKTAAETAAIMTDALVKDLGLKAGEQVMVVVNGTGSTTLMEQLIVFKDVVRHLEGKGIEVVANHVGELLTVQEQAGFQLFMARMDGELLEYWQAPCTTPYFNR